MIRLLHTFYGFLTPFVFLCVLPTAFAQDTISKKIDDSRLVSLYELFQQNPEDEFISKSILDERETIRDAIESELAALVSIPDEEAQIDDSGELSRAIDRQRNIVRVLEERIRERKIDLDLLLSEEEKFYLNPTAVSGAIAQFRTTKSHASLLSRKVVLEERISLLESLLPHQKDRLSRLIRDQKQEQFGYLLILGTYAGIVLAILLIERIIRRFVLIHITNLSWRYGVIKLFSGSVYIFTGLWIFGAVYSRNPGILASFAIVGAGIAIAMQDIIKDIVGWIVIYQGHLFSQGDRITIGDKTGEVIDIGVLHTKVLEIGIPPDGVLEQTGKVLAIPNGRVLVEPVNNYNTTSDFVKAEMRFAITFESDWRKAEEIVTEVLESNTEEYANRDKMQHTMRTRAMYIPYEPSSARVFKDIAADGVEFVLRFTVPIGKRRSTVSMLTDTILERFNKEKDIELAYRTSRVLSEVKYVKTKESCDADTSSL